MSADAWFVLLIGLLVGGCVAEGYVKRPQAIEVDGKICIVDYSGSIECKDTPK